MYLDGYEAAPVLLKKGVSPYSNNFRGEMVGIEISLEFIAGVDHIENRDIHIFTDCQGAIAVFLFTFLGMGAGPLQLGKITREMSKLGKSCGVKFFK